MKTFEHHLAFVVRVQLDIVPYGAGGEKAVNASGRDQFLLNDDVKKSIAFGENLARLCTAFFVLQNAGINTLQSPGMEKWAPVNELAQHRQRKVIQHSDARERRRGQVFGAPLDRSPPFPGILARNHG